MKELVTLLGRLAFLALVVACVLVTYLVMTGEKWQSLKPRSEPKKAATKSSFNQRLDRQGRSNTHGMGKVSEKAMATEGTEEKPLRNKETTAWTWPA
jgi:hypothetical protein